MGFTHPFRIRPLAMAVVAAVTASLLLTVGVSPALADTSPDVGTPATVSTDLLPTPQIDGVVWSQVIVGNTVYVGGSFTTARPAGAAAGISTVARTNLLAYDITTGVLNAAFAPSLNGQVRSVAASPDGTRLYIGGEFTTVNGIARSRIAAFDLPSGGLVSTFRPIANTRVSSVVASNSTVYFGGFFSTVDSIARTSVAAVAASDGRLLPFAPQLTGGNVSALTLSPDLAKLIIGGSFVTANGSSNPGYGLAAVDAVAGTNQPWAINSVIRNGGPQAAITSLSSDQDSVYGTGYVFGSGGNFEGTFRASWADGSIQWIEDCHGDTYSVVPVGNVIYDVGHAHDCSNVGGFPQTNPWSYQRGMAWTKDARTTITRQNGGSYYNFEGNPAPAFLTWWPEINTGKFTGQGQGAWSIAANANYVVLGGEFTAINNKPQQGLVRYAVKSLAPNKDGPRLSGTNYQVNALSVTTGTARVSWLANYDRDNQTLKYELIRNGNTAAPIYTTTAKSNVWFDRPQLGFIDSGLVAGQSYNYRVRVTDPNGNLVQGTDVPVTVTAAAPSNYEASVLNDSPKDYYRLGESSGSTVYNYAGFGDATANATVVRGATGAPLSDSDAASTFNGTDSFAVTASPLAGPNTFSVEAWFQTTSTAGGKIVGFGDRNTGVSGNYDRHVYMDASGSVLFGVYPGTTRIVKSASSYNDGKWHQVVANLSPTGMQLYVDGLIVGQRSDTTFGQAYSGYWRIGGDTSWSGNDYFAGNIDEVAIYDAPLNSTQINAHYVASGRPSQQPTAPTDSYGAAVFKATPELYWRLGESSGTTVRDSGPANNPGRYSGGVTLGAPGTISGTTNTAASFNGVDALAASVNSVVDPELYSLELWFKSTSTTGGKLIGFGNANTGTSGNYDRHVYLQNNGQLVFGTYTGQTNTIVSPASYTDGAWHYVVASQSGDGLKMFVDGALIGTNPTTRAQVYTGYWRVGGDTTWGSTSAYVNSTIDEVAVYDTALSAADISSHYSLGKGTAAHTPPVAAFTATTSDLNVAADASSSAAASGTIVARDWSFGDGSSATGTTVSHAYATAGTYSVTLTVTDDAGAKSSTSKSITVTAANLPPTAAFTLTSTGLSVSVDGSSSSDPDGTVVAYSWNFGDGSTATTAMATHSYAAAGSYPVSLTVTDNRGATNSASQTVSVTGTAPLAADAFARTASSGLGSADVGGPWSTSGSLANYSVTGGSALLRVTAAGASSAAYLTAVSSTDTDVQVTMALQQASTGSGVYTSIYGRLLSAINYQTRVRILPTGVVYLQLLGNGVNLQSVLVPGLSYATLDKLQVRTQVFGTNPTTLRAKIWRLGDAEPTTWLASVTDTTAGLQQPGAVGFAVYLGGSSTTVPVTVAFSNLSATVPVR
ncbi:MAG: PKD domain-containing protein [Microbacteriaceae bacterium]|nr:PKD domain-containing protein [Microbacteriaceae bacterium]